MNDDVRVEREKDSMVMDGILEEKLTAMPISGNKEKGKLALRYIYSRSNCGD